MYKSGRPRVAILISGTGSNMDEIIRSCGSGELEADIAIVISDNPDAPGLKKASSALVETFVSRYRKGKPREESESEIADIIAKRDIDWIVLAGFMRILSPGFVRMFRGRIVNIHPALLPSFPGAHAIRDALDAGAELTGVTIHIVDELVDHGPIIAQEEVSILPNDTEESLAKRIHEVEHRLYPKTLQQLFHDDI
jgi:formyltetrahydrofolate-dependent phosphoribosylglycinamide formyltransferase